MIRTRMAWSIGTKRVASLPDRTMPGSRSRSIVRRVIATRTRANHWSAACSTPMATRSCRRKRWLPLRDANDDAIVSLAELDDSLAGDSQAMLVSSYRNSPAAMRLGPLADWDGVIFTFSELYLRHGELPEGGYSLTPHLAEKLDLDGDGALNRDEMLRLDAIDPHIVLAVRFGPDGEMPPGIDVERIADDLGKADDVVARLSGG